MKIACVDFSPQSRLALQNLIEYAFVVCRDDIGEFDDIILTPVAPDKISSDHDSDLCIIGPGMNADQATSACYAVRRKYLTRYNGTTGRRIFVLTSGEADPTAAAVFRALGIEFFVKNGRQSELVRRIIELKQHSGEKAPASTPSSFQGEKYLPVVYRPAEALPELKNSSGREGAGKIRVSSQSRTRHLTGNGASSSGPQAAVPAASRFSNPKFDESRSRFATFSEICSRGWRRVKEGLEFPFFDDDPRKNSYLAIDRLQEGEEAGWHRVHGASGSGVTLGGLAASGDDAGQDDEQVLPWARFLS